MSTVLLRNETLKTAKRPAARITLGLFAAFLSLIFGQTLLQGMHNAKRPPFALPTAWVTIGGDPTIMASLACAILVIMLVASEFSWRTARQNVIDGLSKTQWYAGKLILFALVCLAFFAVQTGVGVILAAWGTHVAGSTGPLLRRTDLELLGADLFTIAGLGSLAFLAAFITRAAGAAMATFFFYIAVLERFIGFGLAKLGVSKLLIGLLPMGLFTALAEPRRYDPAAHQKWLAALAKAHKPVPTQIATSTLLTVGTLEIALFLAIAYVVYRRRDL